MHFVFHHGAQPFGGLNIRTARGFAFALQMLPSDNFEKIAKDSGLQAFHQFDDAVVAGGNFGAMAGVAADAILNIFGKHVTFGDGQVAQEIAERKFAGRIGPVNLSRGTHWATRMVRSRMLSK